MLKIGRRGTIPNIKFFTYCRAYGKLLRNVKEKSFHSGQHRARLVCRHWNEMVQTFVLRKPKNVKKLNTRWRSKQCSMQPIVPTAVLNGTSTCCNSMVKYRNVLGLKASTALPPFGNK